MQLLLEMAKENILKVKSFAFAVRIINLYKYLKQKHGEYVISQQIIRSGTAIGALIREAEYAESIKDFKHKLNIGLKETNESIYWLELLHATNFITYAMYESIIKDAHELLKMLVSSIKTLNARSKTPNNLAPIRTFNDKE